MPDSKQTSARSSIETVRPEEIGVMTERMERATDMVRTQLLRHKTPNEAAVVSVVNTLLSHIPGDLQKEIADKEGFKAELTRVMREFIGKFQNETPTNDDIRNLIAQLMVVCTEYHAFGIVSARVLDDFQLPRDYEPQVKEGYLSLTMQKLTSIAIWLVASYTSAEGLTNYLGKGIQGAESMFEVHMPPGMVQTLRYLLAYGGAGLISQVVLKIKERIEEESHTKDKGLMSASASTGKHIAKRFGLAALAAAAAIAVFDIGTNVTGIATKTLQTKSMKMQIDEAQKEISARTKALQGAMADIKGVPENVRAQIDTTLTQEEGGSSETKSRGSGPMYKAKQKLYLEQGALGPTPLEGKLAAAVDASGLMDSRSLPQELEDKIGSQLTTVGAMLQEIGVKTKALSPEAQVENLQQDLDKIVTEIGEVVETLSELPHDLNTQLVKYQKVAEQFVDIAKASCKYPDIKPDQLKKIELHMPDVKNVRIQVEKVRYIGFEDLLSAMRESYSPNQIPLFAAIIALLGFLLSYADLFTIPIGTRKAYTKDRAEVDEKKKLFLDHFEDKVCELIVKVLNVGPYSAYFKDPKNKLRSEMVRKALDDQIAELKATTTRGKAWYVKWSKILPLSAFVGHSRHGGMTEVAQEHNTKVLALQQIMSSPRELGTLVQRLLPGITIIKEPKPGESVSAARAFNNQRIVEDNTRLQEGDISAIDMTLTSTISNVEATQSVPASGAAIEEFGSTVEQSAASLARIGTELYPENADAHVSATNKVETGRDTVQRKKFEMLLAEFTHFTSEVVSSHPTVERLDGLRLQLEGINARLRVLVAELREENKETAEKTQGACTRAGTALLAGFVTRINADLTAITMDEEMIPEESLIEIEALCADYKKRLDETPPLAGHVNDTKNNALDSIVRLQGKVVQHRSILVSRRREEGRLARLAGKREEAKLAIGELEEWFSKKLSVETDDVRAYKLAAVLGEHYLEGEPRPWSDEITTRLEDQFKKYDAQIVFLIDAQRGNQTEVQRLRLLKVALLGDMKNLRSFFQ